MMKRTAVIALLILTAGGLTGMLSLSPMIPNPWLSLPPNPLGVSRAAGAVVGGKFYVIGGSTLTIQLGQVQVYDPGSDTWDDTLPTMPSPAAGLCAGVIGADIYVPGGHTGISGLTALQVFHTVTNTWEVVTTDPLPDDRWAMACTAYGGKLYTFGGNTGDGTTYLNTTWSYDPNASAGSRWTTTLAVAPLAADFGAAVVVGNLIFYAGMKNVTLDLPNVYAYDPAGNTWTTYPSLQTARGGAGLWAMDNMLVVGGGGWNSYLTSVEQYDTSLGMSGTWSYTYSLNQGRRSFAFASDVGRLYAGAGWAGGDLTSAEYSDFVAPTNTPTATSNQTSTPTGTPTLTPTPVVTMTPTPTQMASPEPYLFLPTLKLNECYTGPSEIEPNNSSSLATGPLCSDRDYSGAPDQYDLFIFDAPNGGPLTVSLTGHTGQGVQLQLYFQLATFDNLVGSDTVGPDFFVDCPSAQYPTCGQPGRYYIYIFTASGFNATPYTLRVTYP